NVILSNSFTTVPGGWGLSSANPFLGGAGIDTITGGDRNDFIDGGADSDIIDGGIGDDTIIGSSGNDNLKGGNDNDTFDYQAHNFAGFSGTVQTLDGGSDDKSVGEGPGVDLIKLHGQPNDYQINVTFNYASNTWKNTDTTLTYGSYTFHTKDIEKAQFSDAIDNTVSLSANSVPVEMLR